jgi:hypothetical protein
MEFIGQESWREEFLGIYNELLKGNNFNIVFRAPSGYGKTFLALRTLNCLGTKNGVYYFPSADGLSLEPPFRPVKRIHIIDEAHGLKNQETFYPLMDMGTYTFFFLTNESGLLKEPLMNRCIQFIFTPYTEEELTQIAKYSLEKYHLSDSLLQEIGKRCIHPRDAKNICQRLSIIFNSHFVPKTVEELEYILSVIMGIDKDGFSTLEKTYLDFLGTVGTASLDTLSYGTRLDKATIMRDVEPRLIYKNKIKITSKGRTLCGIDM